MDWTLAIEKNRAALKRVLAALVAMAGLAIGQSPPLRGRCPAGQRGVGQEGAAEQGPKPASLPRHLHRAVLRLLRPAEAAARRLVVVAARGVVVPPARHRPRKPGPTHAILRGRAGTGILPPRGIGSLFPSRGSGFALATLSPRGEGIADASKFPSPLRGGVRGGGVSRSRGRYGFQLFDPLCPPRRRRPARGAVPRISFPGMVAPSPVSVRRPPAPHDPIDATRLTLRLAALASALDDLPRQARRFARWRSRRNAAPVSRRARRVWPLRPGRPPQHRPVHGQARCEIHDVLEETHGLALWALERPDTS